MNRLQFIKFLFQCVFVFNCMLLYGFLMRNNPKQARELHARKTATNVCCLPADKNKRTRIEDLLWMVSIKCSTRSKSLSLQSFLPGDKIISLFQINIFMVTHFHVLIRPIYKRSDYFNQNCFALQKLKYKCDVLIFMTCSCCFGWQILFKPLLLHMHFVSTIKIHNFY